MAALFYYKDGENMKIRADVKIPILEGEEKGKFHTFSTVSETDTEYTKYGIIERVKIGWSYLHHLHKDAMKISRRGKVDSGVKE